MDADANFPFMATRLMKQQAILDQQREQRREDSRLKNFTVGRIFSDIGKTFHGITTDLFDGRPTYETWTKDDRLRGVGLGLMVLAMWVLVVRAMHGA